MCQLFRSFETQSADFLLKLYKTFVRPKLEYATPLWSPSNKKDILLIESIQRAFTKRIPEINRLKLSYSERLSYLNLERLDLRRLKIDLIWTHKLLYRYCGVDWDVVYE